MKTNYNPDVLTCLANLSNDEVFTPPQLANRILDLLPADIWSNSNITFLDPFTKSGVFLREITKRLIVGLENEIPNKQERINHILKNQIFGIAITELTSLLSRRSLYCSKSANGNYSICENFYNEQGNIVNNRIEHTWNNGSCIYCGASQEVYNRDDALETYAYQFIHTENPEGIFNMKFDVIIGNPPYQLNDGGGTGSSAKPIYHKFIEQAKKLNPRYLSMIIPARWYSGGKGLDEFRNEMLNDTRIRHLIDYVDSRDCFPGVDIAGGICFFLWDRDHKGLCQIQNFRKGETKSSIRSLNEFDTFIRDTISIEIIKKVKKLDNEFLDNIVSSRMPFGLESSVRPLNEGDLTLITSAGKGKFPSQKVTSGHTLISKWKVMLSKASNDHGGQPDKEGKRRIFSRIEVMPPNTICTESYLVIGSYDNEIEAINMSNFLKTKFCRFLVSSILLTQNITKSKFIFVPNLDMLVSWTDEKLYEKYGLTDDEIDYIDLMIRPMELNNE